MNTSSCILCNRAATLDSAESGWIVQNQSWSVSTYPAMAVPGWVAAQTTRHTEGLADLNATEAADLGPLLCVLSGAVMRVTNSRRVYTYSLGEGCPHTHILMGPPTAGLRGNEFLSALMRREESLTDIATSERIANALRHALTMPQTKGMTT